MPSDADQARELANVFAGIAESIDAYRSLHFNELTQDQRTTLENAIQQIDDLHDTFTSIAVADTLQAIQPDIAQLTSVANQALQSLRHLNDTARVISLVSSLSAIALAITTADWGAIPSSLADIAALLKQPRDPSTGAPA